jgi:hypothetical protein
MPRGQPPWRWIRPRGAETGATTPVAGGAWRPSGGAALGAAAPVPTCDGICGVVEVR